MTDDNLPTSAGGDRGSMLDLLNRVRAANLRFEATLEPVVMIRARRRNPRLRARGIRYWRIRECLESKASAFLSFVGALKDDGTFHQRQYELALLLAYRVYVPRMVVVPEKHVVRQWSELLPEGRREAAE